MCVHRRMFEQKDVLGPRNQALGPSTMHILCIWCFRYAFYVPNVLLPFVSFLSSWFLACLLGVYFDLFYLLEFLIESKASLNSS